MAQARICVLGAGVIGLSSALQVLERYPGVNLTVIAEKFSPDTTSDGSAGWWEPYLVGDTSPELVVKWSRMTYDYLNRIAVSEDAYEAGVDIKPGYNFFRQYSPDPPWKEIPLEFRHATQREIELYAPHCKHGWFFISVICACTMYLPWLEKKIKQRGAKLMKRKIDNLSELAGHYDIILNCTGLGSYHLVNDKTMAPIQGQVIRVKNTTDTSCFMEMESPSSSADAYIFPWRGTVVIGGTAVKGDWSEEPSMKTRDKMLKKCCQLVPSLKNATILQDWTGLRPWRSKGVRIEREVLKFGAEKVHVVHNYGHSGAGVTLHWGCAQDAAALVGQCLKELTPSKL